MSRLGRLGTDRDRGCRDTFSEQSGGHCATTRDRGRSTSRVEHVHAWLHDRHGPDGRRRCQGSGGDRAGRKQERSRRCGETRGRGQQSGMSRHLRGTERARGSWRRDLALLLLLMLLKLRGAAVSVRACGRRDTRRRWSDRSKSKQAGQGSVQRRSAVGRHMVAAVTRSGQQRHRSAQLAHHQRRSESSRRITTSYRRRFR